MFAFVEDNVPTLYEVLPLNWRHISNLSALGPGDLEKIGWYAVEMPDTPTYDPFVHALDREAVFDGLRVRVQFTRRMATDSEIAAARALVNAPSLRELAQLDLVLPRGLEDFYRATGFDISKLDPAAQQKLRRKNSLRAGLK
jgi:hypothetical protein